MVLQDARGGSGSQPFVLRRRPFEPDKPRQMRRLFFLALFWRAARTVDVYYYWVGSVSDPATACVFEHPGVLA